MVCQAWLRFAVIAMKTGAGAKAATGCWRDIAIAAHHDVERTLAGLRGYPAVEAIAALGGTPKQKQVEILRWMYGDVVGKGPVDGAPS